MPDPIRVDFKERQKQKAAQAKAALKQSAQPKPQMRTVNTARGPVGEKAVNWRALPKFLLVVGGFMLVMFLIGRLIPR